jgi:hypothetical protein
MAAALLRLSLLLAVALCSACLPEYGDAPFACSQSSLCPEGYRCVDQVCRRASAAPDARPADRPPAPPADAARDAGGAREAAIADKQHAGKERIAADIAKLVDLVGGLSCKQIDDCYRGCGSQSCADACYNKGSPDGKAKMSALFACEDLAFKTTCDYACTYRPKQACDSCIDQACAAQRAACFS